MPIELPFGRRGGFCEQRSEICPSGVVIRLGRQIGQPEERREEIRGQDGTVNDPSSIDVPWPTHNERDSQPALVEMALASP